MSRLDDLKALLGDLDPTASLTLSALGLDGTEESDEGEEQDEDFDEAEPEAELAGDEEDEENEEAEPDTLKRARVRRTKSGETGMDRETMLTRALGPTFIRKAAQVADVVTGEDVGRMRYAADPTDKGAMLLLTHPDRKLPVEELVAKWSRPEYASWALGAAMVLGRDKNRLDVLKAAATEADEQRAVIDKADEGTAGPPPRRQRGESSAAYAKRYGEFKARVAAMYDGRA